MATPLDITPAEALERLREGNRRFSQGATASRFSAEERAALAGGQSPFAVVVACSDSRVPVEAVFDAGVGELFVLRTAGHVLAAAGLASVRFAIEILGSGLIVVLGHEDCGAVKAAMHGGAPEWLGAIVDHIDVGQVDPALAPADAEDPALAAAVDEHVRDTVRTLRAFSRAFDSVKAPVVVGAAYKLTSGEVHWLDEAAPGAD